MIRHRRTAAVLAIALAGCTQGAQPVRNNPATVDLATGAFVSVTRVGDRVLTVRTGPTADDPGNRFASRTWEVLDQTSGARTPLRLPDLTGCTTTSYFDAFALNADEVGLRRQCVEKYDTGQAYTSYALVGYHLTTRRVRILLDPAPVASYARLAGGDIVASLDSSFCTSLRRYHEGRPVPLGIGLDRDGWPLDASEAPGEAECASYGLVRLPVTNAAGELALVASTDAKGRTGNARVRSTFRVYVVADGVARRVAEAPGWPRAMTWSDDGSTLFLSVDGDRGGIYEVTRDGRTTLISSGTADDVAAFGRFLVVLDDSEGAAAPQRIYRLPLG